jgi:hypothetical protein
MGLCFALQSHSMHAGRKVIARVSKMLGTNRGPKASLAKFVSVGFNRYSIAVMV